MPLRDVRGALRIIDETIQDLYRQMRYQNADRETLEARIAELRTLRTNILKKTVEEIEQQYEEEVLE